MKRLEMVNRIGRGIIGGAAALGLAACGGGDKDDRNTAPSKIDAAPQLGSVAKGEVDIDGLLAYLPDGMAVTFDTSDYSGRSGLTTLKNVRISSEENREIGVEIGELLLAGFNKDFVDARIDQTNFDQSAVVIDHLEARNVSLFGMEVFYGQFNEATLEIVEGFAEEFAEDLGEELDDEFYEELDEELSTLDQTFEEISFTIDRIVIDDFEFLPFETFASSDDTVDEGLQFLKTYVSYNLAIGAKTIATEGMGISMQMTQDGQPLSMSFAVPFAEYSGWRGVDYDRAYTENMTFDITMPNEDIDPDFPIDIIEMTGTVGTYLIEDVRLSKAAKWLARGEWPPTTETDLISFGLWTAKDIQVSLLDKPFYSLDSSTVEMSKFHWLLPTEATFTAENLVYDLGGIVDTVMSLVPDGEQPEEIELVQRAMTVLADYDLSAPSVDFDIGWTWDPDSGKGDIHYQTGLDGYGTFVFDMSGTVASFDRWVDAVKNREDIDSVETTNDAFDTLMAETASLISMRLEMDDRGGNERLFDATIALGATLKDVSPEWATIAAYDKDTMKLLVSSSIKGGAEFAAAEFPPVRKYAAAFADYLIEGGLFTVAITPDVPLSVATFENFDEPDTPEEIEALVDAVGFSVSHKPN